MHRLRREVHLEAAAAPVLGEQAQRLAHHPLVERRRHPGAPCRLEEGLRQEHPAVAGAHPQQQLVLGDLAAWKLQHRLRVELEALLAQRLAEALRHDELGVGRRQQGAGRLRLVDRVRLRPGGVQLQLLELADDQLRLTAGVVDEREALLHHHRRAFGAHVAPLAVRARVIAAQQSAHLLLAGGRVRGMDERRLEARQSIRLISEQCTGGSVRAHDPPARGGDDRRRGEPLEDLPEAVLLAALERFYLPGEALDLRPGALRRRAVGTRSARVRLRLRELVSQGDELCRGPLRLAAPSLQFRAGALGGGPRLGHVGSRQLSLTDRLVALAHEALALPGQPLDRRARVGELGLQPRRKGASLLARGHELVADALRFAKRILEPHPSSLGRRARLVALPAGVVERVAGGLRVALRGGQGVARVCSLAPSLLRLLAEALRLAAELVELAPQGPQLALLPARRAPRLLRRARVDDRHHLRRLGALWRLRGRAVEEDEHPGVAGPVRVGRLALRERPVD